MAVVAQPSVVEAPSGKHAAYENFPVGSFLLPAGLRPHVAVFYAYARAIDDIADSPDLAPEDKIARLDGFERALLGREHTEDTGFAKAHAMRDVLVRTGVPFRHCLDLISAFKQDSVKHQYADWPELIDYCNRSAAPVGRFLLDLHGGSRHDYGPSDALCNALQVLNHLQDCQEDYRKIDRVYLPQDWLREARAGDTDLDRSAITPALRRVLDRCLDGVDALLEDAAKLPAGLVSRRLALESGAIVSIARTLSGLLRRQDPLARRVRLGKMAFLLCCMRGAASAVISRA
jgi:squalene synthase HpnC